MSSPTLPGWYPDPAGGPLERLWDGSAWADQTREHRPPHHARSGFLLALAIVLVAFITVVSMRWLSETSASQRQGFCSLAQSTTTDVSAASTAGLALHYAQSGPLIAIYAPQYLQRLSQVRNDLTTMDSAAPNPPVHQIISGYLHAQRGVMSAVILTISRNEARAPMADQRAAEPTTSQQAALAAAYVPLARQITALCTAVQASS